MTDRLPSEWDVLDPPPDTEPVTVAELVDEPAPYQWGSRYPPPDQQRTQALIRERNRRVDAQSAYEALRRAVEAHRAAIPARNLRNADRALYAALDETGDTDDTDG